ncbi:hypothetical protein V8G54_005633 [Vigna mungo]|uniref:Uncharacterized protein n=1 Tax=Vigna mungo TaxID=3915 RepID=A0AAQ3NXH6_VIGMU
MFRIPTNWVVVFKKHIIDAGINDWCNLPYGVFISKIFSDVQTTTKDQDEASDSDSKPNLLSPKSEFKNFVVNKFERTFKRASKMKKSLMLMNEKMDEIIKNYVESSTSTEESTDEDDDSSKEDSMESSEIE